MSQSPGGREGIYYSRQRKTSERSNSVFTPIAAMYSSGHALPDPNRSPSLVFGSMSKDWDNIRHRKVQLVNFLAEMQRASANSALAGKIEGGKLTSHPMDPTEQKAKGDIIVLDSDDEDGNSSEYNKLASGVNKDLRTSEVANITEKMVSNKTMHAYEDKNMQIVPYGQDSALVNQISLNAYGDKNTQIVPYGQGSALVNPIPCQNSWQPRVQFERVVLQKRPEEQRMQDLMAASMAEKRAETQIFIPLPAEKKRKSSDLGLLMLDSFVPKQRRRKGDTDLAAAELSLDLQKPATSPEPDMAIEEEEKHKNESDGLEDYWKDFALAVESAKLDEVDEVANGKEDNGKMDDTDCNHDIRIHEDLGHVCRVCGMIVRRADSIIDYQWNKASRRRTNGYRGNSKDADEIDCGTVKLSEDFIIADVAIHPRHAQKMKPHQLEGFNFLVKNLIGDKPGGCILAHAPGSGKTFLMISFIQSFMARYPFARPLVVLPKGILGTWKKEIEQWKVQDIPLYDFYSVKAEKRVEQLEILKSWEEKMSILFLGYKQFATIVTDEGGSSVTAACRDRLLKIPNLLILDEGHTPRNQDTDALNSLNRVETKRKVVLSGTLFQNHVKEVFNILDLVRPKFLKMESSRPIAKRIMSQVEISGRSSKDIFTEAVEGALLNDENFKRKAHVIRSLRELTKNVLHYYKGDILDELPGLVDFSVFLKLTPKQKDIIHKLGTHDRFKRSAVGSALYLHPCLSQLSEANAENRANTLRDDLVDSLLDSIRVKDGVKANFFWNILKLASSKEEKVLAFSQYILPMKFFERLLVKEKGWHVGKEIFMISGDTSQEDREVAMERFNNSADAKVLFGSIKACGEGISLVGASRVVILDVHLNPSVTRQAIGRAFRPGQQKKVFVYRLVAADSDEEKVHETAFKKEVIPKLWFEWSEHCTTEDFKLGQVDIDNSGDELLEANAIRQDIKALYRR